MSQLHSILMCQSLTKDHAYLGLHVTAVAIEFPAHRHQALGLAMLLDERHRKAEGKQQSHTHKHHWIYNPPQDLSHHPAKTGCLDVFSLLRSSSGIGNGIYILTVATSAQLIQKFSFTMTHEDQVKLTVRSFCCCAHLGLAAIPFESASLMDVP